MKKEWDKKKKLIHQLDDWYFTRTMNRMELDHLQIVSDHFLQGAIVQIRFSKSLKTYELAVFGRQ